MAKLTTKERKALPKSDFAVKPDHYPIEDRNHARAALSEVAQHGTAKEIATVHRAVRAKYPDMVKAKHMGQ